MHKIMDSLFEQLSPAKIHCGHHQLKQKFGLPKGEEEYDSQQEACKWYTKTNVGDGTECWASQLNGKSLKNLKNNISVEVVKFAADRPEHFLCNGLYN